jgi:hypothetical protein
MTGHLLTGRDRESYREFAAGARTRDPGLLDRGTALADQARRLIPSLDDEQIAVTLALAAAVTAQSACLHCATMLLQAAVADLAHLELDDP